MENEIMQQVAGMLRLKDPNSANGYVWKLDAIIVDPEHPEYGGFTATLGVYKNVAHAKERMDFLINNFNHSFIIYKIRKMGEFDCFFDKEAKIDLVTGDSNVDNIIKKNIKHESDVHSKMEYKRQMDESLRNNELIDGTKENIAKMIYKCYLKDFDRNKIDKECSTSIDILKKNIESCSEDWNGYLSEILKINGESDKYESLIDWYKNISDTSNGTSVENGMTNDISTVNDVPNDISDVNDTQNDTQNDISNDTPVINDTPNDTSTVNDIPNDTSTVNDIPNDTPVINDTPVVNDTPNDTSTVNDIPNDTPVVNDISNDTPVVNDIPNDTPAVNDIPNDTPVVNGFTNNTSVVNDIPNDTPVVNGFTNNISVVNDISNDIPVINYSSIVNDSSPVNDTSNDPVYDISMINHISIVHEILSDKKNILKENINQEYSEKMSTID